MWPKTVTFELKDIVLDPELLALYYGYSFPQRFIAGLPDYREAPASQREDRPLTISGDRKPVVTHSTWQADVSMGDNGYYPTLPTGKNNGRDVVCITNAPKFARDLLERVSPTATARPDKLVVNQPKTITSFGHESLEVGEDSTRAVVFKPTSDTQAQRNLNFAIANLFAAVEWYESGKAKAEEAKKKAEAEAKAEAERKEAERKAREEKARKEREDNEKLEAEALKLYNATYGTTHSSWIYVGGGLYSWEKSALKRKWVEVAREARKAKAAFNPISSLRVSPIIPRTITTNNTRFADSLYDALRRW